MSKKGGSRYKEYAEFLQEQNIKLEETISFLQGLNEELKLEIASIKEEK